MLSLISRPNNNLIKGPKTQLPMAAKPKDHTQSSPATPLRHRHRQCVWGAPKKAFPIYTLLLICVDAFRTAWGAIPRLFPLLPRSGAFHEVVLVRQEVSFCLDPTVCVCVFYYYDACRRRRLAGAFVVVVIIDMLLRLHYPDPHNHLLLVAVVIQLGRQRWNCSFRKCLNNNNNCRKTAQDTLDCVCVCVWVSELVCAIIYKRIFEQINCAWLKLAVLCAVIRQGTLVERQSERKLIGGDASDDERRKFTSLKKGEWEARREAIHN